MKKWTRPARMELNGIPIVENRSLRYDQILTGRTERFGNVIFVGELAHLKHRLALRQWRIEQRAWLHAHVAATEIRLFGCIEENAA